MNPQFYLDLLDRYFDGTIDLVELEHRYTGPYLNEPLMPEDLFEILDTVFCDLEGFSPGISVTEETKFRLSEETVIQRLRVNTVRLRQWITSH